MIPRFSNPHVVQASTKLVSRADLNDSDSGEDAKIDATNGDMPVLTKRLRELVQDKLGDLTIVPDENFTRRKRQKLEESSKDIEQETPIREPFILIQPIQYPDAISSSQYFDLYLVPWCRTNYHWCPNLLLQFGMHNIYPLS
jgi:hypothetical protein